jgi:hypothetical protein
MKRILLFLLVITSQVSAQCVPGKFTYTINGLYTSDLNVTNGDTVLIATTATVTGNINLVNSRIVNCGSIINSRLYIKGNWDNVNGKLENYGNVINDSLIMDSISDLHNYSLFRTKYISMNYRSNIDNWDNLWTNNVTSNQNYNIFNIGHFFVANNLILTNSKVMNYYMIHVKNTLFVDSVSTLINLCSIYVDSLFKNKGYIAGGLNGPNVPKIIIYEKSENYNVVNSIDICDLTTLTSGGFDTNTGTLTNVTYCQAAISCPDYTMIGIDEESLESNNLLLFPNPANSEFSINGLNQNGNYSLRIINIIGQEILSGTETQNVSISNLNTGIYFAEIYKEKKLLKNLKFIKN